MLGRASSASDGQGAIVDEVPVQRRAEALGDSVSKQSPHTRDQPRQTGGSRQALHALPRDRDALAEPQLGRDTSRSVASDRRISGDACRQGAVAEHGRNPNVPAGRARTTHPSAIALVGVLCRRPKRKGRRGRGSAVTSAKRPHVARNLDAPPTAWATVPAPGPKTVARGAPRFRNRPPLRGRHVRPSAARRESGVSSLTLARSARASRSDHEAPEVAGARATWTVEDSVNRRPGRALVGRSASVRVG